MEGDVNYEYARGEFVTRIPLEAGEHFFRASFPELADMPDPLKNRNPDLRRKMGAASREIISRWSYAEVEQGLRSALASVGLTKPVKSLAA